MSPEKLQAPRGTFDVLPEQAAARAAVEREARRIFEAAGYGRIETPTFEATYIVPRKPPQIVQIGPELSCASSDPPSCATASCR